jgi:serine/alanine adding enzyme
VNSASVLATDAELRDQLAQLREQKGQCARRFGAAKRQGQDLEPLKAEMRAISEEIDRLEAVLATLCEPEPTPESAEPADAPPVLPMRFTYSPPQALAPEGLAIRQAAPADDREWDTYVSAHPAASPYHFSPWRRLIVGVMGQTDVSLLARDSAGTIVGILPLIHMKSLLFGNFAISMPYFNYGGPLAANTGIGEALMQEAARSGERLGAKYVEIRETHPREGWPVRDHKVSMLRRLPGSAHQLDTELGSKVRAQVRRARREGPEVLIGGPERVDDFYRVFAENMRDLGTPVYSRRLFTGVLEAWPDRSQIVVVRLGGRPVAAGFLVGLGDVLEIPWASTLRCVNQIGMNMLLYREILGIAIAQGYEWFDFGRSTEDSGTYRFKMQWGADPVRHSWHYWLPPCGKLPSLAPDNPRYRFLISMWQRLPVVVTKQIGPKVVRGIQ